MHFRKSASAVLLAAFLLSPAAAFAGTNLGVKEAVRTYFADAPVMSAIASCESEFRQFNVDGSVLHGGYKHTMIGIFQIAPLHLPEAKAHGFDFNTVAGNIAYAKYLYDRQGTRPWLDSMWCWQKKMNAAAKAVASPAAQLDTSEKIVMLQKQVAQLTAVLNALIAAKNNS